MLELYAILVAIHILAIVVTGAMWTLIDLGYANGLKAHMRDIRAVHFGSLYLVPWLLGLSWIFDRLQVPWPHWVVFPCGLGGLLLFTSIAYLFPMPPGLDPFYYWTRGWAKVLSMIGLACLIVALLWTAVVLVVFAWPS